MPVSNPKEVIDTRILTLVGLEDVFDLDYDTYRLLLKEVLVKNSLGKIRIPDEERDLLVSEIKRVRGSAKKGRFKVERKKKITSNSFNVGRVKNKVSSNVSKSVKGLLPTSKISDKSPIRDRLEQNISLIALSFNSILETLKKQKKVSEDSSEYDRKNKEREKRSLAESKLEKRFEGLKKVAEKIIAPVKSLLSRILDFFTTIIFGRIVYKLVEWMGNPKNASKVKSIIRFLGDWWPALLGSYILFGTSYGKFIRGTLGLLTRFTFQIGKVAIPQLLKFIRSPLGAGALLFTAGATVPSLFPETVDQQERKTAKSSGSKEEKIKSLQQQKQNLNFFEKLQGKGSEIDEQIEYLRTGKTKSYGFSGGGFASGYVSGERGVDKVPAMLSDGEFVMSRGAVQMYGVDTLEAMNSAGGGTNKPKIINGKTYAYGGGQIGRSSGANRNSGYYINEILKGLAPQYRWANDLARKAGVFASTSNAYNTFMNEGAKMHGYLTRGGMKNDIMNFGNKSYEYLKSKNFQNQLKEKGTQLINAGSAASTNALNSIQKLQLGKKYQDMANQNAKKQEKNINSYDSWVKSMPDGFLKETMNRGLIPIPTFNETGMTLATFGKSMLGPLGRPFRIMTNDIVDRARQEMIDKTASSKGLRVDPKTGKLSMDWNRVNAKGSGQYADELTALGGNKGKGKFFNSTFGRWSGTQKGNKIITDDVYNFNETAGSYAKKSKDSLMKGDIGGVLYNAASMAGRFAQDIGWLNQRVLGSQIEVGSVRNIDKKTGKLISPKQIAANERKKQEQKLGGGSVKLYDKPQANTEQPYKSRFARPKNAGVRPVSPPPKTNVTVVKTAGGGKNGGMNSRRSSSTVKTPSFSPTTSGSRNKANTLGITR